MQRSKKPNQFSLSTHFFSCNHTLLVEKLKSQSRTLLIQDLDGVCMGLVRDPLTRSLSPDYIRAAKRMEGHFFVLTNGEHTRLRGINRLVRSAVGKDSDPAAEGLFLPGLAAGGVQWQDAHGQLEMPGVTEEELEFLETVPQRFNNALTTVLAAPPFKFNVKMINNILTTIVLNNLLSPTININEAIHVLGNQWQAFRQLQKEVSNILKSVLNEAKKLGMMDSYFIHYAPNLGPGPDGERIKWASETDWGTTDFQFMIKGAIKEVGVLDILNRYFHRLTGEFPLGEDFTARTAPGDLNSLVTLAENAFDPDLMPVIVGVGDTITSNPDPGVAGAYLRGGSDRGFLTLIQTLSERQNTDSAILLVDSSNGELTRPRIDTTQIKQSSTFPWKAVEGISDPDDSLKINFVFPGGHQEYIDFFCRLSQR